jgi:hypothetical protein
MWLLAGVELENGTCGLCLVWSCLSCRTLSLVVVVWEEKGKGGSKEEESLGALCVEFVCLES